MGFWVLEGTILLDNLLCLDKSYQKTLWSKKVIPVFDKFNKREKPESWTQKTTGNSIKWNICSSQMSVFDQITILHFYIAQILTECVVLPICSNTPFATSKNDILFAYFVVEAKSKIKKKKWIFPSLWDPHSSDFDLIWKITIPTCITILVAIRFF